MANERGDDIEQMPEIDDYKYYEPCAYCKAQRKAAKDCGPLCEMAPYFPAEKLEDFKNAQSLFGVKNIKKMLEEVEEGPDRQIAADSILFEGNMRWAHPQLGSYGIMTEQRRELAERMKELNFINKLLSDCKKMDPNLTPQQRFQALLLVNGLSGAGQSSSSSAAADTGDKANANANARVAGQVSNFNDCFTFFFINY